MGINEGAHLSFEDEGYPVGGLGRSGAEAVGAIMAAAVVYEKPLSRNEVVILALMVNQDNIKIMLQDQQTEGSILSQFPPSQANHLLM